MFDDVDVVRLALQQKISRSPEFRYDHRFHGLVLLCQRMSTLFRESRMWLRKLFFLTIPLALIMLPAVCLGYTETFYVCRGGNGSDPKNPGCGSAGTCWDADHFSNLNNWASDDQDDGKIGPNDRVIFLNNGGWFTRRTNPVLNVRGSGLRGKPITLQGESGTMPIFSATGAQGQAVLITGSWIVVERFHVTHTKGTAFYVEESANHNVIKNCEVDYSGAGFEIHGQNNLITQNYVHDLKMIVNTKGGDDDYGAVGVWICNSNNEISYNRFISCKDRSYDYGYDGGGIEIWANKRNVSNSYIHHNVVKNSAGFMEVGGRKPAQVTGTIVAYNLGINNVEALHFNLGTYQYGVDVNNFRFENNTLIDHQSWRAIDFISGRLIANQLMVRNNIFYGFRHIADTIEFQHSYNLYYGLDGTLTGQGERIGNPMFKSASDYHIQPGSPAIDAGLDLGYTLDFENKPVPQGAAPDIGAYESPGPSSNTILP